MIPSPQPAPLLLELVLSAVGTNPADWTALLVAVGTAVAGWTAYRRLRLDRPRVVEEVAGLASGRLREELDTAWEAVERLRKRERELETDVDQAWERIRKLERERAYLLERVEGLEGIVARSHYRGIEPAAPPTDGELEA